MNSLPPWLEPFAGRAGIAALIDHTLLKPETTEAAVRRLCDEAREFGFAAVCVNGQWVPTAAVALRGSGVRVAAVVDFPLGAGGADAKAGATAIAIAGGAREIDVVIPLGWARAGRWDRVRDEIAAVVQAASRHPVKAILETGALTAEEIERGCGAALEAGAAFVKSSTGFHATGGATVEAVALMRRVVGERAGVKASGGIRTAADALRMLAAGADRLGSSAATSWSDLIGPGAPSIERLFPAE